jgi:hypothetical protein
MTTLDGIKPATRLRGLDAPGIAEIVEVSHVGPDASNPVFGPIGAHLAIALVDGGWSYARKLVTA